MAVAASPENPPDPPVARAPAPRPAVRAAVISPQRNRLLAIVLASVSGFVFVTVITLALLFHYAEVHHLIPRL